MNSYFFVGHAAAGGMRKEKERRPEVALLLLEPYYRPEASLPAGFDAAHCPYGPAARWNTRRRAKSGG